MKQRLEGITGITLIPESEDPEVLTTKAAGCRCSPGANPGTLLYRTHISDATLGSLGHSLEVSGSSC